MADTGHSPEPLTAARLPGGATLAGSQINADWPELPLAIIALEAWLASARSTLPPDRRRASHVVFRCGTVAQVAPGDPEFSGYLDSAYAFPGEHPQHASAALDVMDDNARVWEAQRSLPEPAGKAARQAFALLVAQGYPYPGNASSVRGGKRSGCKFEDAGELLFVFWPALDPRMRVWNLVFGKTDPRGAVDAAGDLRRLDYMFPEVAAVFTADGALWGYREAGGGLWTYRPADGRELQFGPGDRQ